MLFEEYIDSEVTATTEPHCPDTCDEPPGD